MIFNHPYYLFSDRVDELLLLSCLFLNHSFIQIPGGRFEILFYLQIIWLISFCNSSWLDISQNMIINIVPDQDLFEWFNQNGQFLIKKQAPVKLFYLFL